ncbi:MAG: L-2-hydroxyglutarate oxidase [Kiritimatiellae bacterium]|nr:L-2-hydroxyglutarate oxidase [Kiritimatiellia bacterium]
MQSIKNKDIAIIGGGILGLATAKALQQHASRSVRHPLSLVVLEAEPQLGCHQTSHNSGVIHSGLYYRPGSLKAKNCAQGREAMYRFCAEHQIAYERCGKIVVATSPEQILALDELECRGIANGLKGLKRIVGEALTDIEPHVAGCAGLWIPETGIVDFREVAERFSQELQALGGTIKTGFQVNQIQEQQGLFILSNGQEEMCAKHLINCGGLYSDRIAALCGLDSRLHIIPFRGEYYKLVKAKEHLVRHLIYPVPDPRFPFLGVHFTRMIHGGIEAGPNAVLAFKRAGYQRNSFSLKDTASMLSYGGFWRMNRKYWRMGLDEFHRSLSKRAFVHALQALIPTLTEDDIERQGAGVRAQAVDTEGRLIDDFRILEKSRMIHVLNAPSPAATASISIGETIAHMAIRNFGLQ